MKKRMSTSELFALHKQLGHRQLSYGMKGEVELYLKNPDGTIDTAIKQPNLTTGFWQVQTTFVTNFTSLKVFISNDTEMFAEKSFFRHSGPNGDNPGITDFRALDSVNRTWTFQVTFSAPSADRTLQIIGLKANNGPQNVGTNEWFMSNVIAATRLTAPVTQTTIQTLEITYRLSFARV